MCISLTITVQHATMKFVVIASKSQVRPLWLTCRRSGSFLPHQFLTPKLLFVKQTFLQIRFGHGSDAMVFRSQSALTGDTASILSVISLLFVGCATALQKA